MYYIKWAHYSKYRYAYMVGDIDLRANVQPFLMRLHANVQLFLVCLPITNQEARSIRNVQSATVLELQAQAVFIKAWLQLFPRCIHTENTV